MIQKRVVYDLLTMFGDLGGLYDFFTLFVVVIFGKIAEKMRLVDMIKSLFVTAGRKSAYRQDIEEPGQGILRVQKLKFTPCLI